MPLLSPEARSYYLLFTHLASLIGVTRSLRADNKCEGTEMIHKVAINRGIPGILHQRDDYLVM